jgi:hypothetical protein
MLAGIRSRVVKGSVTVLDEMYDGSHHSERHRYTMTLIDGTVVDREIYFSQRCPRTVASSGSTRPAFDVY